MAKIMQSKLPVTIAVFRDRSFIERLSTLDSLSQAMVRKS